MCGGGGGGGGGGACVCWGPHQLSVSVIKQDDHDLLDKNVGKTQSFLFIYLFYPWQDR